MFPVVHKGPDGFPLVTGYPDEKMKGWEVRNAEPYRLSWKELDEQRGYLLHAFRKYVLFQSYTVFFRSKKRTN
jgi:hypothetical protein